MCVCDMSYCLENSQTTSASAAAVFPVFLWTATYICISLYSQTSWFHFRWDYITTMGDQEFFRLPVFLFMLVSFRSVVTQCHRDTREVSIFGKMLQKHIFKTITGAAFGDVCLRECYRDVRCQSFNYVFTQNKCNWVTAQRKPGLKILYPTLRDITSDEIRREVSVKAKWFGQLS